MPVTSSRGGLGPVVLTILALTFAGCLGTGQQGQPLTNGSTNAPDAANLTGPLGPLVTVPVAWDGLLPTGICAGTPLGPCTPVEVTKRNSVFEVPLAGNVTSIMLTMSWKSSTPLTDSLRLTLLAVAADCTGGGSCNQTIARFNGTSPLDIKLDNITDWPVGSAPVLSVSRVRPVSLPLPVPAPIPYNSGVDQSFHVEGSVMGVVLAAATNSTA